MQHQALSDLPPVSSRGFRHSPGLIVQAVATLLCLGWLLLPAHGLSAASLPAALSSDTLPARQTDDVIYTVRPEDTLIGIAREQLDKPSRWQDVQRYNDIERPRYLSPGSTLRLRPEWLKPRVIMATLSSASNDVKANGRPTASGTPIREGTTIRTGQDSSAVIDLPDGTQLRIPSASEVRLERLRAYHDEQDLEALFRLERGSIEPRSPGKRKRPLIIRTPSGNAVVRGTHFRVKALASRSTTEVLRGQVEAGNQAGKALVDSGNGAYFSPGQPPKVEPLLPAPALAKIDGSRSEAVSPRIAFPPLAGASAYRVSVSPHPDFNELLLDTQTRQPLAQFRTRHDGPHYLRVRGISAQSIEGQDSIARIDVRARPRPPHLLAAKAVQPAGQASFAWREPAHQHHASRRYRLQIASDRAFSQILHDEIHHAPPAVLHLHARVPLTRWWRVAVIEDGQQGPFSSSSFFKMKTPVPIETARPRPVVKSGAREPVRTGNGDFLLLGHD